MADAFRIATRVPWDADFSPDWGPRFDNVNDAMAALTKRVDKVKHHGAGFKQRDRGEPFGPVRTMTGALRVFKSAMRDSDFGDVRVLLSVKSHTAWLMRHIHVPDPTIDRPEANVHIDAIWTYVFREMHDVFPNAESWGTCVRRYIDGTTTWSEHSPWQAPDPGCNAVDIHDSFDNMKAIAYNHLAGHDHVAKILFADHEWTPSTGWISASIDHWDHVHVEGPRDHGALAASCGY